MSPEDFERFAAEFASRRFKDTDGMVAWLSAQGYEIKRGAVWRAGSKLKRKLQAVKDATAAAKMVVESARDDEASLGEAVIAMVQSQMFDVMTNLQDAEEEDDPAERLKLLGITARAAADASRAANSVKKHRMDIRAKLDADLEALKKEGFDANTIDAMQKRVAIYLPSNGR